MNHNIYEINLNRDHDKLESFEIDDKNLVKLAVKLPTGETVSGPSCKIIMSLSSDAMLGLGTELIRKAVRLKSHSSQGVCEEIQILGNHNTCQKLGIYLTPDSCELLVNDEDFGTVEEILQKIKN